MQLILSAAYFIHSVDDDIIDRDKDREYSTPIYHGREERSEKLLTIIIK